MMQEIIFAFYACHQQCLCDCLLIGSIDWYKLKSHSFNSLFHTGQRAKRFYQTEERRDCGNGDGTDGDCGNGDDGNGDSGNEDSGKEDGGTDGGVVADTIELDFYIIKPARVLSQTRTGVFLEIFLTTCYMYK